MSKKAGSSSRAAVKLARKQFINFMQDSNEYMIGCVNQKDPFEWHVLFRNLAGPDNQFSGGEYLFRINLNKENPASSPPKFYSLTPNGVYALNDLPCIGTGTYHSNQYSSAGGVIRFLREIMNGIMNYHQLGGGISVIYGQYTNEQRAKFAEDSREYNETNNKEIMDQIEDIFRKYYSKYWAKKNKNGEYVNSDIRLFTDPEAAEKRLKDLDWKRFKKE